LQQTIFLTTRCKSSSIIIVQNFQLQSTTRIQKKKKETIKKLIHPIQVIKGKNYSREETPDSRASTTTS
jgi:hypothetical protein